MEGMASSLSTNGIDASSSVEKPRTLSFSSNSSSSAILEWLPIEDHDKLLYMMRKASLIKDHRLPGSGRLLHNAFKGEEFVMWLVRERNVRRSEALGVGQLLVERYFATTTTSNNSGAAAASGGELNGGGANGVAAIPTPTAATSTPVIFETEKLYQLEGDEDPLRPLNFTPQGGMPKTPTSSCHRVTDIGVFNDHLCKFLHPIYADILSSNGRCVYYELLEENESFAAYLALIRGAARLTGIETAPREARLAFFINLYNMMLLHVVYKHGLPTNVWEQRKQMNGVYMQVGEHLYSANSILNGVLRGNRRGADSMWEPFGDQDPRKKYIIEGGEPLVHFALNTLSQSSPPIRAYSTAGVMDELRENARRALHLDDFLRVDQRLSIIHLAQAPFKSYAQDFAEDNKKKERNSSNSSGSRNNGAVLGDVVEWLLNLLIDQSEKKKAMLRLYHTAGYALQYMAPRAESNLIKGYIKPS